MPRVTRPLAALALLALLPACAAAPDRSTPTAPAETTVAAVPTGPAVTGDHAHILPDDTIAVAAPEPRLVVADAGEPVVRVYDLATEQRLGQYVLDAPAQLRGGPDTPFVVAVQPAADTVSFIDGGSWIDGHAHNGADFHVHYYTREARLLSRALDLPAPGSAHVAGGEIAVYSDDEGAGAVHLVDEPGLHRGEVDTRVVGAAGPQDGFGLPVGEDGVVVGNGNGVTLVTGDDSTPLPGCTAPDGSWAGPGAVAVGCAEGVLTVGADGSATAVAYPDGFDGRVDELAGSTGGTVAGWSGATLLLVDTAEGVSRAVELPAPVRAAGMDPAGALVAVTADGAVHQVDSGSAEIVASTEPGAVSTPDDVPTSVVVGGERAYLTDTDQVLEFATNDDLRLARTLEVDGEPGSLVLLGAAL